MMNIKFYTENKKKQVLRDLNKFPKLKQKTIINLIENFWAKGPNFADQAYYLKIAAKFYRLGQKESK